MRLRVVADQVERQHLEDITPVVERLIVALQETSAQVEHSFEESFNDALQSLVTCVESGWQKVSVWKCLWGEMGV